jgi:hypothetical protein
VRTGVRKKKIERKQRRGKERKPTEKEKSKKRKKNGAEKEDQTGAVKRRKKSVACGLPRTERKDRSAGMTFAKLLLKPHITFTVAEAEGDCSAHSRNSTRLVE